MSENLVTVGNRTLRHASDILMDYSKDNTAGMRLMLEVLLDIREILFVGLEMD